MWCVVITLLIFICFILGVRAISSYNLPWPTPQHLAGFICRARIKTEFASQPYKNRFFLVPRGGLLQAGSLKTQESHKNWAKWIVGKQKPALEWKINEPRRWGQGMFSQRTLRVPFPLGCVTSEFSLCRIECNIFCLFFKAKEMTRKGKNINAFQGRRWGPTQQQHLTPFHSNTLSNSNWCHSILTAPPAATDLTVF